MRKVVIACLILMSTPLLAHNGNDGFVTADGYKLWSNTYGTNVIRVFPSDGYYNPASCANVDSYFVSTEISLESQQRIYSTLLAAKLASKPVVLRLDTDYCEDNRPRILHVIIE